MQNVLGNVIDIVVVAFAILSLASTVAILADLAVSIWKDGWRW